MNDILSETELAELICTRISHDVIGNVGAVSNAVELLEEGDMDFLDDIRSILKVSSSVLSARLKFFRLAFGLSNANLERFQAGKVGCGKLSENAWQPQLSAVAGTGASLGSFCPAGAGRNYDCGGHAD